MTPLTSLDDCLTRALGRMTPLPPAEVPLADAVGQVLAAALTLPRDLPARPVALRAGIALIAAETVGASPALPLPLSLAQPVQLGEGLPEGADAVISADFAESAGGARLAIRPASPGEGIRRAGHDGRAGLLIAETGQRLTPRAALLAAEAGLRAAETRRPRVALALDNPAHAAFAGEFARAHGAALTDHAPDLLIRTGHVPQPRLALGGAETAWLGRGGDGLVLDLPPRFDGMIAGLLALCLPALRAMTGAAPQVRTRPVLRKIASAPGMADPVLLTARPEGWLPHPPGLITLAALTEARAFAILPASSEGLATGQHLDAAPILPDTDASP